MLEQTSLPTCNEALQQIDRGNEIDEILWVEQLLDTLHFSAETEQKINALATRIVSDIRQAPSQKAILDEFLKAYDLSSDEGIALLCLAEAFLRIPDKGNLNKLIGDKLSGTRWKQHTSDSMLLNTASWTLMLTGKILSPAQAKDKAQQGQSFLRQLLARTSAPFIRTAIEHAMGLLAKKFVMGTNMANALSRAQQHPNFRYSFDMLGEAAITAEDAETYFEAYRQAILHLHSRLEKTPEQPHARPSISVKLSAIYPRYEVKQHAEAKRAIVPKLLTLIDLAQAANVGITIDAEEAARLTLSLDIFTDLFSHEQLSGWDGLGLAVQGYQKRAPLVIDYLSQLSQTHDKRIPLRLVKGAYWDTEIKHAQVNGYNQYPVYTLKRNTDLAYLHCVEKILAAKYAFHPQFATHNVHSIATIITLARRENTPIEFQCLHGMGDELYEHLIHQTDFDFPVRVYAPVGKYEDLLPYLVRRLLENGANTSFINQINDKNESIEKIIASPITLAQSRQSHRHSQIPLPGNLYAPQRHNAPSLDLDQYSVLAGLESQLAQAMKRQDLWLASSLTTLKIQPGQAVTVYRAASLLTPLGKVCFANADTVSPMMNVARNASVKWSATPLDDRIQMIEQLAELLWQERGALFALAIHEAGKTREDALAEIREAIDFCYYYISQAHVHLGQAQALLSPTGETNRYQLRGRGVIACISPWNFPLAIFLGQIIAALLAGNTVVAKPAPQTCLMAHHVTQLCYKAGIPRDVLQLILGQAEVGQAIMAHPAIDGVIFTGSTQTARRINQTLANKTGPIIPFIAETGGVNAMIVDSSALLEQVIRDVIASAFGSSGQRCSACRVVFVQTEVMSEFKRLLAGAMAQLRIGDTQYHYVDIGPVIDTSAQLRLQAAIDSLEQQAKLIFRCTLPEELRGEHFIAPVAYEIDTLGALQEEHFGPILHVIPYSRDHLARVIADINASGYALTLGIHSRIDRTIAEIISQVKIGNVYVNRNMIGAVVGVQPFGGSGLSGTGPKAGGPLYLPRLCTEQTITVNTAATGGNTELMRLEEV